MTTRVDRNGFKPTFDARLIPARGDLAAATLRGKVEAARFVAGRWMEVREEVLDLRGQPNPEAGVLTQALHGEAFCVYEDEEGWAWGQLKGDGYVGYLSANGLREPTLPATHRVVVPRSFAYPIANIKAPIVTALPMGAQLTIVGEQGLFLRTQNQQFVIASHLSPIMTKVADFVSVVERFLNVPYLWGGKTSLGLDCSGLIQIALAQAGIFAPRDSDMQMAMAAQSLPIAADLQGLQRGDLVFWRGHIGVMGDRDYLIHANGHAMMVTREPLLIARARTLASEGGDIIAVRRLG